MGSWLIFQHPCQMRWGDGWCKVIGVLDVPVAVLWVALWQIRARDPRGWLDRVLGPWTDWQPFQEKPLSFSLVWTVPQTDTGGRDEYSKALERTREKELGKLIP